MDHHYLVPQQEKGSGKDIAYSVVAITIENSEDWFVDAKDRLLDVNSWNKYCPDINVAFRLTDNLGLGVGRHAHKGDHMRIDMPGPDGARLGGFEWVTIEAIEYDDYPDLDLETFAMRLRVADSPLNHKDGHITSILGNNDATATLVIERAGAKLCATYHSRNEKWSIATSESLGMNDAELTGLIKAFVEG